MHRLSLLKLNLIPHLSHECINGLIEKFSSNIADVSVVDLQDYGLSRRYAQCIYHGLRNTMALESELRSLEENSIQWTTILDHNYPPLLKASTMPPPIIYWKGDLSSLSFPTIACVGSRKATQYGYKAVETFLPPLIERQWTIISGGAYGIDTRSHEISLACQGKTVAVMGNGLAHCYPRSNRNLFEKIIAASGALISFFPSQVSPRPENFPLRNRLIVSLAYACMVIQASIRSGARITARLALDEGRELFVVPGPFDDPLSEGCNHMLREGAHPLTSYEDILSVFETGSTRHLPF